MIPLHALSTGNLVEIEPTKGDLLVGERNAVSLVVDKEVLFALETLFEVFEFQAIVLLNVYVANVGI